MFPVPIGLCSRTLTLKASKVGISPQHVVFPKTVWPHWRGSYGQSKGPECPALFVWDVVPVCARLCSHMCAPMCSYLRALIFMCSHIYVLSYMCSYVLSFVCSHMCAPMCSLLRGIALICVLSFVVDMCALIYMCVCVSVCALTCMLLCAFICVRYCALMMLCHFPIPLNKLFGSLAGILFFGPMYLRNLLILGPRCKST